MALRRQFVWFLQTRSRPKQVSRPWLPSLPPLCWLLVHRIPLGWDGHANDRRRRCRERDGSVHASQAGPGAQLCSLARCASQCSKSTSASPWLYCCWVICPSRYSESTVLHKQPRLKRKLQLAWRIPACLQALHCTSS